MKVTRIALAILSVAVFAACSSDITAPSDATPTTANTNIVGYGGEP